MSVKLLTEHHLEFLSLKGGCRGSSESTLVKMSNCWKSHATAHKRVSWLNSVNMSLVGKLSSFDIPAWDNIPITVTITLYYYYRSLKNETKPM